MDTSDIDKFLRATKMERRIRLLAVFGALALGAGGVVAVMFGGDSSVIFACLVGFLFGFSFAEGSRWGVSRSDLLRMIENQINRDPDALRYLASARSGAEQAAAGDARNARA